ncbi:hypothetical protein IPT12_12880 [Xanthomonas perforans]|uniref:Secreted protein n=9 Tax=Xanthomonas TaxID=338 RepID=A0A0G8V8H4_XANPE|nr:MULTISPECIES: hypothetical protein [Xanthomonas]MBO9740057.1 hypothetical protein [Xanthomonas axonopodis pv. begoniae]MCC4626581.1 hypothetical protein [Xanthomonas campestris pv. nigromaculans]OHX23797.1 hypothetical protein BHL63_03915 [Xanthomonas alfalfae]OQP82083.1 hypothetical protein IA54_021045 [Xanthomonas phaseoli pv. syngonii LMG 9055]AOY67409.1 hypothetical protein BHE83_13090 [Xanthomonas euvesicatoria pv. vesicatoria str. 85-10]
MIGDSRRLPWMWTMRRITVCLLLLLAPLAALASDQLIDGDHDSCISTNSAARGRTPAPEAAPARNSPHKATPSTGGGGGSDGDSLFPRMRTMPRWHSFLPGMFR